MHQLGAVHLYTQESPVYRQLNQDLAAEDRSVMVKWFSYLKLIISAIATEPKVSATLWRGIKADIASDYPIGRKFRWYRFTACTEDGNVLKNPMYLGQTGTRTLFSIECFSGRKIVHLSDYKEEAEVLLPPETRFEVKQVINPAPGLTVIVLKEIASGLCYTESSSTGETKTGIVVSIFFVFF